MNHRTSLFAIGVARRRFCVGAFSFLLVAVAATVFTRYEGGADDRALRPLLALLGEGERLRVQRLGLAMQLAYRLSGGVPAVLAQTRIEIDGRCLVLHLAEPDLLPEPGGLRSRLQSLGRSLSIEEFRMILPQGNVIGDDF